MPARDDQIDALWHLPTIRDETVAQQMSCWLWFARHSNGAISLKEWLELPESEQEMLTDILCKQINEEM